MRDENYEKIEKMVNIKEDGGKKNSYPSNVSENISRNRHVCRIVKTESRYIKAKFTC